jgi:hypothetical protein
MTKKKIKKAVSEDLIMTKKYLFAIGIMLVTLLLVVGLCEIISNITTNNLSKSYLVSSKTISADHVVDLNKAKDTFSTLEGNYFIYVSYTNNSDVYNLEKKLKKVIDDYKLNDNFYYINIDSIMNNPFKIEELNTLLGYQDSKISTVPTIIYVNKDNLVRIENIISRSDNTMMNVGDFQHLLDINEIVK